MGMRPVLCSCDAAHVVSQREKRLVACRMDCLDPIFSSTRGNRRALALSASSACALLNRAFALLGTRSRTLLQSIFAASASPSFSVLAALHEAYRRESMHPIAQSVLC